MQKPQQIGAVVVVLIVLVIFIRLIGGEINYIQSPLDGSDYLVRNLDDSRQAANMLAQIKQNIGVSSSIAHLLCLVQRVLSHLVTISVLRCVFFPLTH